MQRNGRISPFCSRRVAGRQMQYGMVSLMPQGTSFSFSTQISLFLPLHSRNSIRPSSKVPPHLLSDHVLCTPWRETQCVSGTSLRISCSPSLGALSSGGASQILSAEQRYFCEKTTSARARSTPAFSRQIRLGILHSSSLPP